MTTQMYENATTAGQAITSLAPAGQAPPVLFDIDNTLLDTDRFFHQVLWPRLTGLLNISESELNDAAQIYFDQLSSPSDFHPIELLQHLATNYQMELERLKEVAFAPGNVKRCRFDDVLPAMDRLGAASPLGIYSEGVRQDWQEFKLESLGVLDRLQPELIFIEMRKLKPEVIARLPEGAVVVDDKPAVVTALTKSGRVQPVLIDRQGRGSSTTQQITAPAISSLTQLPELIVKLHHH